MNTLVRELNEKADCLEKADLKIEKRISELDDAIKTLELQEGMSLDVITRASNRVLKLGLIKEKKELLSKQLEIRTEEALVLREQQRCLIKQIEVLID